MQSDTSLIRGTILGDPGMGIGFALFRMIPQWQDQNRECRGGSGNSDETLRAYDRREAIGAKFEAVGWCYGREAEYGDQTNWHGRGPKLRKWGQ